MGSFFISFNCSKLLCKIISLSLKSRLETTCLIPLCAPLSQVYSECNFLCPPPPRNSSSYTPALSDNPPPATHSTNVPQHIAISVTILKCLCNIVLFLLEGCNPGNDVGKKQKNKKTLSCRVRLSPL